MIELCQHDQKYLSICQHYLAIFNTPLVQKDEEVWKEVNRTQGYNEMGLGWGVREVCGYVVTFP